MNDDAKFLVFMGSIIGLVISLFAAGVTFSTYLGHVYKMEKLKLGICSEDNK